MSSKATAIAVAAQGPRTGAEELRRGEEEVKGEEEEEEWSVNEERHRVAESVVRDAGGDPLCRESREESVGDTDGCLFGELYDNREA